MWSILIIVGAAQGFFLAIYWFAKADNRRANKWLALLLTAVSLHLVEYAADISGFSLRNPFIIAATYPLLFLMGPLFFIYSRALLDTRYTFRLKSTLHFLPASIIVFLMLPFYAMPPDAKVAFVQGMISKGVLTIPVEQFVFMAAHVLQTIAYVYSSYRFIRQQENAVKEVSSNTRLVKRISWLKSFSLFFSIYLGLYLVTTAILTMVDSFHVEIDYVVLLITAASIYAIGYTAINNPDVFKSIPAAEPASRRTPNLSGLKEKLLYVMQTNKPYQKNDLRISDLSDDLGVSSHQLSQLINDEFKVNFYDFVNQYRVEDAKKLLAGNDRNLKMLAIAYEVGFNSKATFNRVFKKLTDLTPSEFQALNSRK